MTDRKGRMAMGAWLVAAAMAIGCAQGDETDPSGFVPVDEPDASASGGKAGGSAGSSNTGGSSGSTSKGGAAGSGGLGTSGSGGSAGASGKGGAAQGGSSGAGGGSQGGASGASGASGAGGIGGSSGASGSSGAAGSAGAAGSGGSAGTGGSCIQTDGEVNDSSDQAIEKAGITDCDSAGSSFSGTLKSAADQDWFKFHGNDNMGCQVNPTFEPSSTGTLVVCAYFECDSGTTNIDCGSDADPSTSSLGLTGCCSSVAFSTGVNCSGTLEDSSTVYVQVKSASNNVSCLGYTIGYHY